MALRTFHLGPLRRVIEVGPLKKKDSVFGFESALLRWPGNRFMSWLLISLIGEILPIYFFALITFPVLQLTAPPNFLSELIKFCVDELFIVKL